MLCGPTLLPPLPLNIPRFFGQNNGIFPIPFLLRTPSYRSLSLFKQSLAYLPYLPSTPYFQCLANIDVDVGLVAYALVTDIVPYH
jgi:hypothetical protein